MSAVQPDISVSELMTGIGRAARDAADALTRCNHAQRNAGLSAAAAAIRKSSSEILDANEQDVAAATERGISGSMLDRLRLDADRVEAMATGIDSICKLDDPLGQTLAEWERPNGLRIQRISVPLGVIGIIYESRPNVTADAASLCLKSGNAVILRGGSESFHSSMAIHQCVAAAMAGAGLPPAAVQMIPTKDRDAVGYLLSSMSEFVDVIVPRGGKNLIARVQQDARVPVIGHLEGLCHVYLHAAADTDMACQIASNAKMRRTGICGAAETLLIDKAAADRLVSPVCQQLADLGCEIRGDDTVARLFDSAKAATEADWSTEYLDAIISVRVVDGIDEALKHIRRYGSGHTESIVTEDQDAADQFLANLDSAILLHNASTQFADGGEFGMGAEIGIATGKIHARGPVGAAQLTSYKYQVRGSGQTRP